jgi:DNA-binding transcriptional LysR family regulator
MDGSDALWTAEVRTALTVAELTSFSRAGRRLAIEQSTVSRRIRGLEGLVGVPLFERNPFGVRPTPVGRTFLSRIAHIRRLAAEALSEARQGWATDRGILRLGSMWPFAAGQARALVAGFRARHPGVRLRLTERGPAELVALLLEGALDCALVDPVAAAAPGLCYRPLWRERIHQACATAGTAAPQGGAYLCRTADGGRALAAWLAADATVGLEVQAHDCSRESLMSLVAAGEGVTLVPESLAALGWTGVRASPLADPRAGVDFGAAWRRGADAPALRWWLTLALAASGAPGAGSWSAA